MCLLVILEVRADGTEEFVALAGGFRECALFEKGKHVERPDGPTPAEQVT